MTIGLSVSCADSRRVLNSSCLVAIDAITIPFFDFH